MSRRSLANTEEVATTKSEDWTRCRRGKLPFFWRREIRADLTLMDEWKIRWSAACQ